MAAEARSNFMFEHSLAGSSGAIPWRRIYTRTLPDVQDKMRQAMKKSSNDSVLPGKQARPLCAHDP
jgi:hypothetical protein